MRDLRLPVAGLMTAGLLWLAAGCGDSKPSVDTSEEEATVKGTVTVNGTPAKEGEIVFDPSNYLRKAATPRTAPIGADGSYTVKTLVGDNRVTLGGTVVSKNKVLGYKEERFDVKPGDNTFNFALTTSGSAPKR